MISDVLVAEPLRQQIERHCLSEVNTDALHKNEGFYSWSPVIQSFVGFTQQ